MYHEIAAHLRGLGTAGLELVTEFVFPPTCAGCNCSGTWFCPMCQERLVELDQFRSGLSDHQMQLQARFLYVEPLRRAIHLLKYERQRARGAWFADQLLPLLHELGPMEAVLEPVPLTSRRERERGFNQSREIARHLAERTRIPVGNSLCRIRETRPQVELNGLERIANVRGAFVAEHELSGKQVILIDDVITTGATLRECAAASFEAGASEVIGLAVATGSP